PCGTRRAKSIAASSASSRTWRAAPRDANIAWRTPPAAPCTSASKTKSSRRSGSIRRTRFIALRKATLDFALAAASVPNAVTDDMFAELRKHWTEEQIVEIVGVISLFGFLNRWNDTMATPLEDEPVAVGERYLKRGGWTAGKHRA